MAPISAKKGKGGGRQKASATASSTSNAAKKRPPVSKTTSPSKDSSSSSGGNNHLMNNADARKATKQQQQQQSSSSTSATNAKASTTDSSLPAPAYLISCDIPTKQYILYLNEQIMGGPDKKFIIQDLDATHVLIKPSARAEIERKLDLWLDENIFSAIEKVGEDFDVS